MWMNLEFYPLMRGFSYHRVATCGPVIANVVQSTEFPSYSIA